MKSNAVKPAEGDKLIHVINFISDQYWEKLRRDQYSVVGVYQ